MLVSASELEPIAGRSGLAAVLMTTVTAPPRHLPATEGDDSSSGECPCRLGGAWGRRPPHVLPAAPRHIHWRGPSGATGSRPGTSQGGAPPRQRCCTPHRHVGAHPPLGDWRRVGFGVDRGGGDRRRRHCRHPHPPAAALFGQLPPWGAFPRRRTPPLAPLRRQRPPVSRSQRGHSPRRRRRQRPRRRRR